MRTAPYQESPQSTRTLLRGIWAHLSRRRRIQLVMLLVVMLASGGAELVSLGAVLPFLAVLSDLERLWQQPLVQALAARVGFTIASELLLPVTLLFAAAEWPRSYGWSTCGQWSARGSGGSTEL